MEGRMAWKDYVGDAHAIVYVVDACAPVENDFADARQDLNALLGCKPLIKKKPLVMYVF